MSYRHILLLENNDIVLTMWPSEKGAFGSSTVEDSGKTPCVKYSA